MKLRLRHNSIRLRLGKSEVERLLHSGECRETIAFSDSQCLEYALASSPANKIAVSLAGTIIRVEVPESDLAGWCSSDEVGLSAEVWVSPETALQVLIEKDFRCLDPRVPEDQSDTFDNPLEPLSCGPHR